MFWRHTAPDTGTTAQPRRWVYPGRFGCLDDDLDSIGAEIMSAPYSVALGKIDGAPVLVDLNTAPHLLIAGTTGSGKSVCVNTIINSLLVKCTPAALQLYIIDPKRVDYAEYADLPHVRDYATGIDDAERVLNRVQSLMMHRYDLMSARRVKHIDALGYNHIVLICDEFASLMSKEGKRRLLPSLQEIARLGRAAGVHMILATQRPTRDVIDGQLKANCPTRIAFRVQSVTDSRVILDAKGAEQLRGKGDGLLMTSDGGFYRFQGLMCSPQQTKFLIDYYKHQAQP